MQLRTFTLRFNPTTERLDESAVAGFLADKEVVSLQNHFFVQNDVPYLLVVVCYRVAGLPAPSADAKPGSTCDESWRQNPRSLEDHVFW